MRVQYPEQQDTAEYLFTSNLDLDHKQTKLLHNTQDKIGHEACMSKTAKLNLKVF